MTNQIIIATHLYKVQQQLVIIDSIQTLQSNTLESPAGSVSQIRECARELHRESRTSFQLLFKNKAI